MRTFWQQLKQRLRDWMVLKPQGLGPVEKLARMVRGIVPDIGRDPPLYPNTLTNYPSDATVQRPRVFEPSLTHTRNAFRQGEPSFQNSDVAQRWRAARRMIMDRMLRLVSDSLWREHLVLRGSLLLQSWFPESAREPGDIDWVVTPSTVPITSLSAGDMMADLMHQLCNLHGVDGIRVLSDDIRSDEIWSYERAPGRRILVPWQATDLPQGFVQMDVVFGEPLFDEPRLERISHLDGSASPLNVASKELSLAWKLMWLMTDMHPQGKDLYDAVLLAEHVVLPFDLLANTLNSADTSPLNHAVTLKDVREIDPDWDNFRMEYPWVSGSGEEWVARLVEAVAPSFPDANAQG